MSRIYYITPYNPKDWKNETSSDKFYLLFSDFRDFSEKAKVKWSLYTSYSYFSWAILFDDNSEITGEFRGECKEILALSKPVNSYHFNQFILWYRIYILKIYQLFLFGEGSWDSLEITYTTTSDKISQFTGLHK